MSCYGRDYVSPEDIAGQLVEQLSACCETALPLPENVIEVTRLTLEVLFPGFGRVRRLTDPAEQIAQTLGLLQQIEAQLQLEIGRAITHAQHATLRVHSDVEGNAAESAAVLTNRFLQSLPQLQNLLKTDVEAAFNNDPAAASTDEILLCYPGVHAVAVYRIAHRLYELGVPYLPRILSEWVHKETGIDIHPAAKIGPCFFIDHGTGVVIGETAEVGAGVTLYQGVTLGAWSFPRDDDGNLIRGKKRHPTLQDGVTVYSNASILGGLTIIGAGSTIGSGVTLSRSVPANSIVTTDKPSLRIREAG